jgi:outer membrane receptor for ferrienterochelin and colicin
VDNASGSPVDFTYINKDGSKSQWYGAEFLVSHRIGGAHRVSGGGEYRNTFRLNQWNYDENPYFLVLDDQRTEHLYALFLEDEIVLGGGVTLIAGIRYDHYDTFGGTTNPRLAVLWTPRSGTTLAGNVTGGFTVAHFTLSGRKLLPWLEVSASVYNLLDKSYADPGGEEHVQDTIPQDGRSFRVKATASF